MVCIAPDRRIRAKRPLNGASGPAGVARPPRKPDGQQSLRHSNTPSTLAALPVYSWCGTRDEESSSRLQPPPERSASASRLHCCRCPFISASDWWSSLPLLPVQAVCLRSGIEVVRARQSPSLQVRRVRSPRQTRVNQSRLQGRSGGAVHRRPEVSGAASLAAVRALSGLRSADPDGVSPEIAQSCGGRSLRPHARA